MWQSVVAQFQWTQSDVAQCQWTQSDVAQCQWTHSDWHSVSGHTVIGTVSVDTQLCGTVSVDTLLCGTVSHKNESYDLHSFESVKIIKKNWKENLQLETLVTSQPMFVTFIFVTLLPFLSPS